MKRLATGIVVAFGMMLGVSGATSQALADPYVSMGDSSSVSGTYVNLLYSGFGAYSGFDETLGADEHLSLAQGGQGLGGLITEQLPTALATINDADDAKAVTIGIGGNEGLGGCFTSVNPCGDFGARYEDLLVQVKAALANDPGEELFVVLAYFNPKNGLAQEVDFDHRLLGANLIADQCPSGSVAGLNDAIMQAASKQGVPVADAYPAFKEHGQAYIGGDQIHPNAAGNLAIAEAFIAPKPPATCPDLPVPTCETDSSLCPPDPTCQTDASLCPPDPTCETDQSLCPDRTSPQTRLVSMKRKGKRTVTFRFTASERGSFKCSIDGQAFVKCRSPRTYKGLNPGRHVFRVRATDRAGNIDKTPVRRVFRIRR